MPGCSSISRRLHLARDNRRQLYQDVSSAPCCWDPSRTTAWPRREQTVARTSNRRLQVFRFDILHLSSVHLRSLPGSEFNLLWSSFSLFCRISSVPFALSKVALYLASSEFVASNSALSASSLCLSWSRRQRPFRFCCNSLLRGMRIQFERHLHLCGLLISPSVVRTLPYRNRQNPLCRDAACRADQSSTDFHGRQCSHSGFLRQWPDYP